MAECDWAILCDYAFLDANRKMCMIGAFDRIFTPAVPTVLHQSSIALKMLGDPGTTLNFRIEVVRPSGGQLASVQGTLVVADTGTVDVQLNIAGLNLPDYGVYSVNVFVDDALSKATTFLVTQPPTAPTPPQA